MTVRANRTIRRTAQVCRRWLDILCAAMGRDARRGLVFSPRTQAAHAQYAVAERRMLKACGVKGGRG